MPTEVERKLNDAGYVPVRVVVAVSHQKRAHVHRIIDANRIECQTYKHAKYPKWAALRKVLPIPDILGLPATAEELLPFYGSPADIDGDDAETTEGDRVGSATKAVGGGLPPLIAPRKSASSGRTRRR